MKTDTSTSPALQAETTTCAPKFDSNPSALIFVHSAVDESGLEANSFRVYAHLSRRAGKGGGEAWAAVESMAHLCRLEPRTVRRCLGDLLMRRMISKEERPGRTTVYQLARLGDWRQPLTNGTRGANGRGCKAPRPTPDKRHQPLPSQTAPDEGNPSEGNPSEGKVPPYPPSRPSSIEAGGASPLARRVGAWFKREESNPWSSRELRLLANVEAASPSDEDLNLLEGYYQSDCEVLRRDVKTLLINWSGEIDRARSWKKNPKNIQPCTGSTPRNSAEQRHPDYVPISTKTFEWNLSPEEQSKAKALPLGAPTSIAGGVLTRLFAEATKDDACGPQDKAERERQDAEREKAEQQRQTRARLEAHSKAKALSSATDGAATAGEPTTASTPTEREAEPPLADHSKISLEEAIRIASKGAIDKARATKEVNDQTRDYESR
jgi:hypothetical protein